MVARSVGETRGRWKGRRIPLDDNLTAIRPRLEDAGVEIIPAKAGNGVGVRLREDQ